MDYSDFEYHKDKVPSGYKENQRYFQHLEQKIVEEILASPTAVEFFKDYSPDSIKTFVERYAGRKAHLAKNYNYYAEKKQRRDFKFRNKAETVFNAIKQKKLFNLQLQWRAELVTIEEINFSYDFEFWGRHIDDCSFVPEIVPVDVEIMKQYLREEDAYKLIHWMFNWQDYDEFVKRGGGDDENMPDWFMFYDNRMGTRSLLLLPDKRGDKEKFYKDIGRKEIDRLSEEERKKNPPPPYVPPLPHLYYDAKKINDFAKFYEKDKHFLNLFDIYYDEHIRSEKREVENNLINEAIEILKDAEGSIIMPGGLEWRQAIIKCAQMYELEMISNELDTLYSEYCMFNELGISRGKTREVLNEEYEKDGVVKMIRKFILKGRELCGEPLDFNF